MKIEIDKLISVTNYAKLKNLSRQHVYRLTSSNELTLVNIDNIFFIFLDEKAINFQKKRKEKTKKQIK
jgi:hypothetical protein